MSPITVHDDTIVQEVMITASAERIFAALTKPEELLKWWCVEEKFKVVEAECHLQPGGKWMMRVAGFGPNSSISTVHGEYRSVEPPSMLSYTWIRDQENYPETLVRWDLKQEDGGTRVRVTHSGLITEGLRARNSGWSLIVMLLQAHIDREP